MTEIRQWEGGSAAERAELAASLYQILSDVYQVSPWSAEQLEKDLCAETALYFLAEEAGAVIGFLALQVTAFEAEVLQIAVRQAYQGRKIATALFENLPADRDIFLEVRESNCPALLFYKKEKFKEIARRKGYYHAPAEDAIVMKRESHER
ncbi:ribosomal protein S18-alanine N-acetyltransferase [Streptococcus panodentis]|uniref:[Ribosomal protein bS18]-alanine N-acetyltransferase n=1 Tax=Streptococcus panodentis TaxID=1581472 RepID=A0ABS5AVP9_9STRE|nr:ribosomal protein S18-alanine N-acetyltransferase [Streptococcus panodentis]MBP2620635.1 ribosomal-protein-alanine N-acetyltransferase [Streptococcus panodentis]